MDERAWEERGLHDAILRGDEEAWRVLYDRHFTPLYRYVRWRTDGDVARAEDVVQEAWTVAVRRIGRFDPARAPFGAWLRGIADGVLRNAFRRWARRRRTELPVEADALAACTPTRPGERLVVADAVATTLAALPEHYQDVLDAKYGSGLSVAEIAATGTRTRKAVESLLARARAAFRAEYARVTGTVAPRRTRQ